MTVALPDDGVIGWVTLEEARTHWNDVKLATRYVNLLWAGWEMCEAYAPKLAPDAPVPQRYKEAQVLAAQAIYQASRTNGDTMGPEGEGYALATPVLSGQIRQLLRPGLGGLIG